MNRSTSIGIGIAALLAGSAIIGTAVATNPAAADEARSLLKPFGLTTCNTLSPCTEFMNKGSGPAIRGDGTKGEGVVAVSQLSAAVRGTTLNPSKSRPGSAGVVGVDQSTDGGILNAGVTGESLNTSNLNSPGVLGLSNSAAPGVLGEAAANAIGSIGIEAAALSGGIGLDAVGEGGQNRANSTAIQAYTAGGVNDFGLVVQSDGTSIFAQNFNQSASPAAVLVGGTSNPSTNSLVTEDSLQSPMFWVDDGGNAHVRGLLFTSGPCSTGCLKTKGSPARLVQRYTPQESVPTIEDVGEAQLSGGSAYIRIDSAFANVMDREATYLVFVTPQGLTRGLYVTNKTAQGFQAKEEPGGNASVAFDYRIVAKPLGQSAPRLPMIATPLVPKAPLTPHIAH